MKLTVKKFAELTGVSVRTVHYYGSIGLLSPDFTDSENGYRYYGENALRRMQEIMFYRELDFSLNAINEILSLPSYNRREALKGQKRLLQLKRERLDRIISAIDELERGEITVNFDMFKNQEFEQIRSKYSDEVKSRFGDTAAYSEHIKKTAGYTEDDWKSVSEGLNSIVAAFAAARKSGVLPNDEAAIALAKRLQGFITQTQYTCTDEILLSLADMYIFDERFKRNIDSNGIGTAEFISASIKACCSGKQPS